MILNQITQQPIGITMARQEFSSAVQRDVFYLILNQIKKSFNVSYDIYENLVFFIPTNLLRETNFKRIKKSISDITATELLLVNEDLKQVKSIRPFFEASYCKQGVSVSIVNKYARDFISLSDGYSQYQLSIMQSLRGDYSQRMYEILSGRKNFKDGIWYNVSVEYLKYILCADKCDTSSKFMQRVISRSQQELHEKADIHFTYDKHLKGKKLDSLTFHIEEISEKEKVLEKVYSDYEIINGLDNVERANVYHNLLNNYSFTEKQQHILLGDMKLFDQFYKIDKGIQEGIHVIKTDKTAYMAKSLGFDKSL